MAGQSVYDLYEFYLEPRDLKKAHLVTVANVRVENVINPRAREAGAEDRAEFLNREEDDPEQDPGGAMVDLTGTDIYSKWIGHEVGAGGGYRWQWKADDRITTREESGILT